ncbi:MAG TPA: DUF3866 family protein [Actinomycetota bacterium]|nr:DUF3866 family protein [Actinomycetota bacterium]
MPHFATGEVVTVLSQRAGVCRLLVRLGGEDRPATAFTQASGPVQPGDRVVLNTTAVDLGLGTGGEDFVVWNLAHDTSGELSGGHILKLRYTPWQTDALLVEAPESPHHAILEEAASLGGMPVVACGVHSHLAAVAATLKARHPSCRLAYLMTDGAALPLGHSDLVASLVGGGLIDVTLTAGHAFGGDLECVNVFSGLAAARRVAHADVTLVAPGPGIVGTDTTLGHTGMEVGLTLTAAAALGGEPIASLRISAADPRERHRGVSHHTVSALRYATPIRSRIAVPVLEQPLRAAVWDRLQAEGIVERHDVTEVDAAQTLEALAAAGLQPHSMGRSVADDAPFHLAAGAAALLAAGLLARRAPRGSGPTVA